MKDCGVSAIWMSVTRMPSPALMVCAAAPPAIARARDMPAPTSQGLFLLRIVYS
jgi:hypothetical protein